MEAKGLFLRLLRSPFIHMLPPVEKGLKGVENNCFLFAESEGNYFFNRYERNLYCFTALPNKCAAAFYMEFLEKETVSPAVYSKLGRNCLFMQHRVFSSLAAI